MSGLIGLMLNVRYVISAVTGLYCQAAGKLKRAIDPLTEENRVISVFVGGVTSPLTGSTGSMAKVLLVEDHVDMREIL
jgi:hypothetical protein